MKTIVFFVLFTAIISPLHGQQWIKHLPQNKSAAEISFYEYQSAFYSFWEPFNVVNGYYLEEGTRKKAIGWKQFKRWEHSMKNQIDVATGLLPDRSLYEISKESFFNNKSIDKSFTAAEWTPLGPITSDGGFFGIGRINSIAFHPSDPLTYWVGSAGGGLWVTHDDGTTWDCLTDGIAMLLISDVLIPSDFETSNTIYIATGDKAINWKSYSIGVLKSVDGGVTWNSTALNYAMSSNKVISKLVINPNNDNEILAATSGGVYKTIDGGNTWGIQLTNRDFVDLEAMPGDFGTIHGSTREGDIYLSTDSGANWSLVFTGVSPHRIELAVSPDQPTWVYAILANSDDGLFGIFKSENGGASYFQVFDGSNFNMLGYDADGSGLSGQAWYTLTMAVSPLDANSLVIGGVNAWKSVDGGVNWEISSHWYDASLVNAVHADKHTQVYRSNGDLFEGNDGGIYFSSDNGNTWVDRTNGIGISQIYRLGISQTNSEETITGLQDNGTKLFFDGTWSDVKGGDGMECIIDYSNDSIQYGTYVNGQISRTMDRWNSSVEIQPGAAGEGAWVTPYVMDPEDPTILYAGYSEVWKTTDRGANWEVLTSINSSQKIQSMAIAPSNTQILYMSENTRLWKTTDAGESWTNVTNGLPITSAYITYIAIKNDDPSTLWVTMSGFSNKKVYESTNGGQSWVNISAGLPSIPMYSIVQNKFSVDSVQLFVASELGVYTKLGTANWEPFNAGLPNVKVNELELFYSSNLSECKLQAATYGRGLWQTTIYHPDSSVVGVVSTPALCIDSSQSAVLTLSSHLGAIQWEQSIDGISNWINVTGGSGATTEIYTTEGLVSPMSYRAIVTQEGAVPRYSNITRFNIKTIITFDSFPKLCNTDPPLVLNFGHPEGGSYSGSLVNDGLLLPTLSSLGSYSVSYTIIDSNSCSSSAYQHIQIIDCTEKPMVVADFVVYPNPVKDFLEVQYNSKYSLMNLIDATGKIVYSTDLKEDEGILFLDCRYFPAGLYTLQFLGSSEKKSTKIQLVR